MSMHGCSKALKPFGDHFAKIKLDTVVVKGINDDELGDIVEFSRHRGIEPRFIEYMDVGGATQWSIESGNLPE